MQHTMRHDAKQCNSRTHPNNRKSNKRHVLAFFSNSSAFGNFLLSLSSAHKVLSPTALARIAAKDGGLISVDDVLVGRLLSAFRIDEVDDLLKPQRDGLFLAGFFSCCFLRLPCSVSGMVQARQQQRLP